MKQIKLETKREEKRRKEKKREEKRRKEKKREERGQTTDKLIGKKNKILFFFSTK